MSEVVVLIFPTGMEVITKVVQETDTEIVAEMPLILNYQMQEANDNSKPSLNFNFLPFAPLTTPTKTFFKVGLVGKALPKQGLMNAYQQVTGQVITPPSAAPAPELILS